MQKRFGTRKVAAASTVFVAFGMAFGVTDTLLGQSNLSAPSTLPPDGYDQPFWVDSRGCRYLRNLTGGAQPWIPQVRIDGKHICDPKSGSFIVDNDVRQEPAANTVAATPKPAPAPVVAPKPTQPINSDMEVNLVDGLPPAGPSDGTPTQSGTVELNLVDELPPAPGQTATSQPAPAPRPTPAPQPAPVVTAPAPAPVAAAPVVAAPKPAPVAAPAPTPAPKPAPVAVAPAPEPAPVTVAPAPAASVRIQLGNFGERINVDAIVQQLRQRGYSVTTEKRGKLTSVFVAAPADDVNSTLNQIRSIGFPSAFIAP